MFGLFSSKCNRPKIEEIKSAQAQMYKQFKQEANAGIITYFKMNIHKYGVVRIEEWPEGLVLWVGGVIVWRSFKP